MKEIKYHRVLSHLQTERTVNRFNNAVEGKYKIADKITGETEWCDFIDDQNWGECTNAFQTEKEAEYLFKNLFNPNLQALEKEYAIKITDTPTQIFGVVRECKLNTKKIVITALDKKLKKSYPYLENGFHEKGILIVGIFDPNFGGFQKDIEFNSRELDNLKIQYLEKCQQSSFKQIILVDVLTPFDQDPTNLMYNFYTADSVTERKTA